MMSAGRAALDRDTLGEIIDLLAPLVATIPERQALLRQALPDSSILREIDWHGPTHTFIVQTATRLIDYGEISPGEPALWAVLDAARERVGVDRQGRIDALRDSIFAHAKARRGRRPTPREQYLKWRADDVKNRLKTSIHRAVFLDIAATESPDATRPWTYQSRDLDAETQTFTDFDSAFEHYEGRVLLLGGPGSGKTTTLLDKALDLLYEAQLFPDAPVPLLLNLSLWQDEAQPFMDLLAAETARDGGVPKAEVAAWIEQGDVALLLDGLDELAEERRPLFVEALNEYLNTRRYMNVIVCSRINEYAALQAEDARLCFDGGAMTLQPLTSEQIDDYLTAADAGDLRPVLRDDAALYELAQAPLTLSMMMLAYGGLSRELIPADLSTVERRRHLFDMYTARMLQRKERRDAASQDTHDIDFEPDFDAYTYPPDKVNKHLGWLGIRLAEQAKTEFPLDGVYRFLEAAQDEGLLNAVVITNAIPPFVWALIWSVFLCNMNGESIIRLALVAFLLITSPAVYLVVEWAKRRWSGVNWDSWLLLLIGSFVMSYGGMALAVDLAINPLWLSNDQVVIWVTDEIAGVETVAIDGTTGVAVGYQLACAVLGGVAGLLVGAVVAVGNKALDFKLVSVLGGWPNFVLSFGLLSALIGWLIGGLGFKLPVGLGGWMDVVLGVVAASLLGGVLVVVLVGRLGGGLLGVLIGGSLLTLVGILGFGVSGMLFVGLIILLVGALIIYFLRGQLDRIEQKYIVNPISRRLLILSDQIPRDFERFLDYCVGAMLLKRAGSNYAFVHDLLRDHFALRELVPRVQDANPDVRLLTVQRIARLGDTAHDALETASRDEDERVRQAALTASKGKM